MARLSKKRRAIAERVDPTKAYAIDEAVAEPLQGPVDTADVDEVVADAKDHGGTEFPATGIFMRMRPEGTSHCQPIHSKLNP